MRTQALGGIARTRIHDGLQRAGPAIETPAHGTLVGTRQVFLLRSHVPGCHHQRQPQPSPEARDRVKVICGRRLVSFCPIHHLLHRSGAGLGNPMHVQHAWLMRCVTCATAICKGRYIQLHSPQASSLPIPFAPTCSLKDGAAAYHPSEQSFLSHLTSTPDLGPQAPIDTGRSSPRSLLKLKVFDSIALPFIQHYQWSAVIHACQGYSALTNIAGQCWRQVVSCTR